MYGFTFQMLEAYVRGTVHCLMFIEHYTVPNPIFYSFIKKAAGKKPTDPWKGLNVVYVFEFRSILEPFLEILKFKKRLCDIKP